MHNRASRLLMLLTFLALLMDPARGQDKPAYTTLEPEQFEKHMKDAKPADVVVLDVRTPEEYKAAHLKDAVLVDYKSKDFDPKIKALDKSKTYFVYCASGYRSSSACRKLQSLEFPNLYNLNGGITAWQKAGKPVQTKDE
jgi:rhodanese-related sulfurtransferase